MRVLNLALLLAPCAALVCNVRDRGALGDGVTLDTAAFEACVEAVRAAGHGTVLAPAGRYLIAPINLTSNLELFVDSGSTIVGTADMSLWPVIPGAPGYGQGRDYPSSAKKPQRWTSLIHGESLTNVTIRGAGMAVSTIDGQGEGWWTARTAHQLDFTRGHLVELMYSRDVRVLDIKLKDSPFWTTHIYDCDNVHISGVHVQAPHDSPNTDGFDPDSSRDVLIENSLVENGDDCVAIKAGWDCFGVWYGKETANLLVRNLTCAGKDGVVIGSEMSGGVVNVTVQDVTFKRVDGGSPPVHIKTAISRSGRVVDIRYSGMTIVGRTETAVRVDAFYGSVNPSCPANWSAHAAAHPPIMRNYAFVGIHAERAALYAEPVHVRGLPSSPVTDVFIDDTHVNVSGVNGSWVCENVVNGTATADVDPPPCDAFKRIARPLHASAGLACGCCGHVYDPDKDGGGLHRTSTLRTHLASPRARYDREHRTLASPQGCPSMSWPTPGFARTAAAQRALTSPSSQPTARFRGRISRRAALHPGLRRAPSTHYEPAITSTRATPSARGARGQLLRTRSRRGLRKSDGFGRFLFCVALRYRLRARRVLYLVS